MFPPLDIIFRLLYVMFTFNTRIFYREVPGFATDCHCSIWQLLTKMKTPFLCFFYCFTSWWPKYDNTLFYFPYFHVSNIAFILHSTLILSFYKDVVLTLSIINFLHDPHNRHPIASAQGWATGCLLWVQCPIYVLTQLVQWCIWYHVVFFLSCYNGMDYILKHLSRCTIKHWLSLCWAVKHGGTYLSRKYEYMFLSFSF